MRNIALLTALLVVLGAVPVLAQNVAPPPGPMPVPGSTLSGGAPLTPAPPGQSSLPAPGGTLPGGGTLTAAPPGQSSLPAPGGTLPGATAELTPVTK